MCSVQVADDQCKHRISFALLGFICCSRPVRPDNTLSPENGGGRWCGAHGQAQYVVAHCHKRFFHPAVKLISSKLLKFGKNEMWIFHRLGCPEYLVSKAILNSLTCLFVSGNEIKQVHRYLFGKSVPIAINHITSENIKWLENLTCSLDENPPSCLNLERNFHIILQWKMC